MKLLACAFVCLIGSFALSGCSLINPLWTSKSEKEKEIIALREEYTRKLGEAESLHKEAVKKVISSKDAQLSGAANAFYGQDVVFRSIISPTRTDLITHNLAMEGWAAVDTQPTFEAMKKMNERLAKELDATKTSLADLQANHAAAMAENQALAAATKKHQQELAAAERKIQEAKDEYSAKLNAKQGELIEIQQKLIASEKARADEHIASEKARADEQKARQAMIAKLSWGAGIIAALCIAGAIWSPLGKKELLIAAVSFGGVAVALPFVEMWHVMTALGVVLAGICGYILYKYRKEERVSDALVLAAQDVKENEPEVWKNKLAPVIEDRLKKYVKKGGKLVAEKDPVIEAHIDQKLAEFDALGQSPLAKSLNPTK